jgi:GNAT superfamily N-acetyltransferase
VRRDSVAAMAAEVRVEPLAASQLDALLPLIASYQRFYAGEKIDDERNRAFFSRFIAPSEDGMLIGAWRGDDLLGYACLFWSFTSLLPAEMVLMNDLYVVESARGEGVGRALIEASAAVARERGAQRLEWSTQLDNRRAQRLYDSTGAERSEWLTYELRL